MPLFEWSDSPSSSPGAKGNGWVYWAVTLPATVLVLVVWRIWYVFDEWRWCRVKKESVIRDFWAWVRSAWTPGGKTSDLEVGNSV